MTALLPCPFCGGDANPCYRIACDEEHFTLYGVSCARCQIGYRDLDTQAEANQLWNTRTPLTIPPDSGKVNP